jgi:choline dehydrogenase-like flavoprotein
MTDADFIVIGSGPAGVSAALPLVEAGRHVLMIDGAVERSGAANAPWQRMLGERLEALRPDDGLSPKLRTPEARQVIGDFKRWSALDADTFLALGALARGGLSRVWGGFVSELDANDLEGWPVSAEDLAPSYRAIAARIGISGSHDDDMAAFYGASGELLPAPPIGPTAELLLRRYRTAKPDPAFALGLARNALITADRGARQACDLSLSCLWGCARGAIYDARQDLALLRQHSNFELRDGAVGTRLIRTNDGWEVTIMASERRLHAPRVIAAAGVLGSLRLVAPLLDLSRIRLTLLNSPVLAVPLLVLKRLGHVPPAQGYTLAQLGFRLALSAAPGDYVTGGVYETAALPPSSFAVRLPLGRCAATQVFRTLAPALLVATIYFPGRWSANEISIQYSHSEPRIRIRGGVSERFHETARAVQRRLKKIWRALGARVLPGGSLAIPGTDAHFGGVFPMGALEPHGTSQFGELNAAPGLYIVDGAVLPTIPAKFTTLTIMANADRVGRHLAGAP